MNKRVLRAIIVVTSVWAIATVAAEPERITSPANRNYFDESKAVTFFAFDNVSIPLSQNLKLQMRSPRRHAANPVVARGPDAAVDSWAVQFYGSVLRDPDSGKYRMWYVAVSKSERLDPLVPRSAPWRVAYAESDDGVQWTKPNLGLVESRGDMGSNLVALEPRLGVINLKVLDEPDDPDPSRRYKMAAHVWFPRNDVRLGTLATYASGDGLSWKLLTQVQPVDAEMPENATLIPPLHFEPVGGLYKWDGLYHVSGQNAISASRPFHGRVSRTVISPDFIKWTHSSAIQFVRSAQHRLLGPGRSREGEQTHEGISVWNRGNVLVGISGMWHGAKEWPGVTVDLGLVISNDGVHFREPAHEHVFLKRGDDGQWDQGGLLQGQGFVNVDGETYVYYGAWDSRNWQGAPARGGVGIATLPRDRFADLMVDTSTKGTGNYQLVDPVSEFITRSFQIDSMESPEVFINADGLGDDATLKIELLNHSFEQLPDYAGQNASIVGANGYQIPVIWKARQFAVGPPKRIRIKVTFQGKKKTAIRFSALYVR